MIYPTSLETSEDEDFFDWKLSNRIWFHNIENKNNIAICFFDASAGLNIIMDKSVWTLGEQFFENETAFSNSWSNLKLKVLYLCQSIAESVQLEKKKRNK